jgi:ammonia channel protein AmtB
MMDVTRTQELRRYQANSRRIQQWSLRGLVAGVAAGLVGAVVVGAEVGLPIAALAGIVGGAGWWITRGHIEEFEQQLRGRGRR